LSKGERGVGGDRWLLKIDQRLEQAKIRRELAQVRPQTDLTRIVIKVTVAPD
jgi:hypothetical protein